MTSFTGHVQFKTVDGLKQVKYHLSSSGDVQWEKLNQDWLYHKDAAGGL